MTKGSEWHFTFCERQSDHIFSYHQQRVRLHILWKSVWSHLFQWPTASGWHYTFCERQSHHIFSYDQQQVSDIAHFVKGSLITSFPMTNREWVTLHILWKTVSSHLFLWPTACEWHCTVCERQSHHIFSYDQQEVSDTAHFVKGSPITYFPMTNSEWVTLHILWMAVSQYLCLSPTVCEYFSKNFDLHSHHTSFDECLIYHYILFINIR